MAFKTMDDIDENRRKESIEKIKVEISEDINDVLGNVFGRPKTKTNKKWVDRVFDVLKVLGIILLIIIAVDIILGSIWLLRFLIKNLFGMG